MSSPASIDAPTPLLERIAPGLVPELRGYLGRHRGEVETMIRPGGAEAGISAGVRYAKAFDGLLCSLFHALHAALLREGGWHPVSLAAVGSYGRGALSLHSDLDVRLLCARDIEGARPIAEALLYPLWDAGLSIGHQIVLPRDMIELAQNDLPTATTLLDWRVISGESALSASLLERAFEGVFGHGAIGTFLERLEQRTAEREERYGGSVYLLEPDVKNGAGGLRDLDIAHWAARARWRITRLADLVRIGVLVPREWQQIEAANELFWRVRNLLHFYAGRRSDRLSFDRQEQLAVDLGYGGGGAGVERFMSEYYRHARAITRARALILGRAAPPPKRKPHEISLGNGLKILNGAITFDHAPTLEEQPELAFRLYDEAVRRNLPVYSFARDTIARAAGSPSFCERLRADAEAGRLFVKLCTVAQRTRLKNGSALQELHDVGLLVAMIPEFAPVVGRVHHDVYHVYTVDAHSVAAVDRLSALCRGELTSEYPLASRLAAEISRPNVLFFATLLHDVGKDIGGKNHSERGAELARQILARLAFPDADVRELEHLVLKHLRMYHVAARRDIDDPNTLSEFCGEVHGREGLRELYLLTVCDLSTTSPTAMTSWKARMLDELYVNADNYLDQGALDPGERAQAVRLEVLKRLEKSSIRPDFLKHFLHAIPERYLYANDPPEIVAHVRFAQEADPRALSIAVLATDERYLELGVIADDRPGLLAMITATLAAARFNVVSAQIHSWKDAAGRVRAFDLFWVRGAQDPKVAARLVPRLERDLARLISAEITPLALVLAHRQGTRLSERPSPEVPTKLNIDNRASSAHTVLEVTTRDRPGLLFRLANTLQQADLSIALAKINTEGTRVADVFYITDAGGAKLTDGQRIQQLEQGIIQTIRDLQEESV